MSNATLTEQAIVTALSEVFGDAVFPDIAPDQTSAPFAVYSLVSLVPNSTLADGDPLDNSRYQVDCYATNRAQALTLGQAARFALLAIPYPMTVDLALQAGDFDNTVKLYRVIQDFSFWTPRSIP